MRVEAEQRELSDYPKRELTPEYTKRHAGHDSFSSTPLRAEVVAAYDYVDQVVDVADLMVGNSPAWYGWALREAFLAGVSYAESKTVVVDLDDSRFRSASLRPVTSTVEIAGPSPSPIVFRESETTDRRSSADLASLPPVISTVEVAGPLPSPLPLWGCETTGRPDCAPRTEESDRLRADLERRLADLGLLPVSAGASVGPVPLSADPSAPPAGDAEG